MTTVIKVPQSLDEHSFEQVLEQVAGLPEDAKMLLDARHTKWASPYGLAAMLTLGQSRAAAKATFAVPDADETLSYWNRANFFFYAADVFDLQGVVPRRSPAGESQVLLPLTPVAKTEDVHEVVGHLQQQAQQIIAKACKKHGVVAGIHNATAAYAVKMIAEGYQFVTLASDSRFMAAKAAEEVGVVRKTGTQGGKLPAY